MVLLQSLRSRLAVAIVIGVWTAGFLLSDPWLAITVAAAAMAAALTVPVRPLIGGLLALLASVMTLGGGVPFGSVDLVALYAVVGVSLGRVVATCWPGVIATLGFAITSAGRDGFALEKAALCFCVFGSFWVFGSIVRVRADNAEAAVARAIDLAQQDPVTQAERAVEEERERLASEATAALRSAVTQMRSAAQDARADLDPAGLTLIRQRGIAAVDDLRELLILLRSAPTTEAPKPDLAGTRRPVWVIDVATSAAVAVVLTALIAGHDLWAPRERWQLTPTIWVLYVGVVLAIGLRRYSPTWAAAILAVTSGVMLLDPPDEPYSLLPAAGAYLLVTWSAVISQKRSAAWSLAVMASLGLSVGAQFGEHGVGFIAILFTMATFAALAWGERDRVFHHATQRSFVLQEQLQRSVSDALGRERVRAARELHDIASHAVGVMLLHTGAAMALRAKDPAAARQALDTVETQANTVLARINHGASLFDEQVTGSTDLDVGRLIDRMRAIGMRVSDRLAPMPTEAGSARTVFRILQEGLVNAGRHAPGSRVVVETVSTPRGYLVRVTDDGNSRGDPSPGSGFGLVGLRERVRAYGGRFQVGPHASGYRIEAFLPHVVMPHDPKIPTTTRSDGATPQ